MSKMIVEIEVGPRGQIVTVDFKGGSESILSPGRLKAWLPRLFLELRKAKTDMIMKRKYNVEAKDVRDEKQKQKELKKEVKKKELPSVNLKSKK